MADSWTGDAGSTDINIGEYLGRVRKLHADQGTFYAQQIVSAEDLAAMYRTATVLVALVTLTSDGITEGLKEETLTMAEGLLWQYGQLSDPERNWTE